jgi:hypothetical protein
VGGEADSEGAGGLHGLLLLCQHAARPRPAHEEPGSDGLGPAVRRFQACPPSRPGPSSCRNHSKTLGYDATVCTFIVICLLSHSRCNEVTKEAR